MNRAGKTDQASRYYASATYKRARRRETIRTGIALAVGFAVLVVAAYGAVWGLSVWASALPAMFN
jgi:hypothetical protein